MLQNFSASRTYFDGGGGKYLDNSGSTGKYFDNKYFPGPSSDFSSLLSKNQVTTAGYPFGHSNMLQPGFSSPQNIIGTKPTSAFPQFSSGFPLVTSSFSTLGSNSYPSAFNVPPYFNSKHAGSDSLNNNYIYPPNIFTASNKLPPYSNAQGSTQIYPPYGHNGLFQQSVMNSPILGNTTAHESGSNTSNYNQSPMLHGDTTPSIATTESLPVPPIGLAAPSMVVTSVDQLGIYSFYKLIFYFFIKIQYIYLYYIFIYIRRIFQTFMKY